MCETMAKVPIESNSSYIITEDMIDAAMTEHFAYQDDIESEEELSSHDENMEVDGDTQGSSTPTPDNNEINTSNVIENHISEENATMSPKINGHNSPTISVLVIETGLDKSQPESESTNGNQDISHNASTELVGDNNLDKTNHMNNSLNSKHASENNQSQTEYTHNKKEHTDKNDVPLLKRMLSEKPNEGVVSVTDNFNDFEPITVSDSDTDEMSADELTEVELIDDELKSVMESNLMAEVGIMFNNKKRGSDNNAQENSPPKIAVKSISQISTKAFNSMPQNSNIGSVPDGEEHSSAAKSSLVSTCEIGLKTSENTSKKGSTEMSVTGKDQVPVSTIHFSKIAVPHHTFVNTQGKKMKCVYVRNPTSLPLVINSNQSSASNHNIKYMLAPQVKKAPLPMSPLAALATMTKKAPLMPKPIPSNKVKVLSVASKLQKPPLLQNNPSRPHQFQQDQNYDSLVKSLLFHNLKKPYSATDLSFTTTTYTCVDCSDRFVLPSSLTHHLARRTISIRYWCRLCKAELLFYNRCLLLRHLRAHNISIKLLNTSCINFSPIAKDVVEKGIVSSLFKESATNTTLPASDSILKKCSKDRLQNEEAMNSSTGDVGLIDKMVSPVSTLNIVNNKITSPPGQLMKSVCFQTPTSVSLNKPMSAPVLTTQSSKPLLANHLAKTKKSLGQGLHKQPPEQSTVANNQTPKSVILFCNKLPPRANVNVNNLPINVSPGVGESALPKVDSSLVVNLDINGKANKILQEEQTDVENVMVENNSLLLDKLTAVPSTNTEKKTNRKRPTALGKLTSKQVKRNCSECGVACLNISKHLNGINRPCNTDNTCQVCQLILPTKCALKIHIRIHLKMAPYKCPDCGKDFNLWDEVHAHVKFSCGHLAKCVRYMCTACKSHFPSKTVLGNHIKSKHSREIFKCKSCPVAFFNKSSLNKHILTNHFGESDFGTDYKQCSLCPKKLIPVDKFFTHIEEHTKNNNILIYGYKCPMCSVVFANKMAFIIHQIKEKKEFEVNEEQKNNTSNLINNKTSLVGNQINEADVCGQDEIQLSDSSSDIEDEPVIIRKYPELNAASDVAEKDPLSLEDWEFSPDQRVKEKRVELCIVCKNNSVVLLPGIDLNEQSLCCKQCVKPLDVVDSTMNSFLVNNAVENTPCKQVKRKRSSTPKYIQRSLSCDEVKFEPKKPKPSDFVQQNGSPNSDVYVETFYDFLPVKKKNRKKQNREKLDPMRQTHIQGQVITAKSPNDLICSKCEFVADTKESFLSHITVHRTDPNTFQCLECGLCFVVLPTLEKHLQMHHGIKDVSDYTEQNSLSLPQKPVSEEEDDNQCRVCNELFDSSSSLEKHFRTHGMAFMNSLSKSP